MGPAQPADRIRTEILESAIGIFIITPLTSGVEAGALLRRWVWMGEQEEHPRPPVVEAAGLYLLPREQEGAGEAVDQPGRDAREDQEALLAEAAAVGPHPRLRYLDQAVAGWL